MRHFLSSLALILVFAPATVFAAMTSTNYTIYADVVGVTGGALSTSTSFSLTDTIGEPVIGETTSTTYNIQGGFQAAELSAGGLSISLTDTALHLGTLSAESVSSATTILTIDATDSGYALTMSAVSGVIPFGVADGAVTAGFDEYGFSLNGINSSITGDVAPQAGLVLASSTVPVAGDAESLTFKASRSSGASASTYGQQMTLTLSANP